ncbi:hypothetical protein BVY04_01360 [bacterium M21]|nr:hypothetical protein BVY04_01360 [bacterium M21]
MKEVKELKDQRDKLLTDIQRVALWVNGSVIETTRKQKGKEEPFYYLSQSIKGKNKITYISASHLERFKAAANEGLRLKVLLSELSMVNIKLIKAGYSND